MKHSMLRLLGAAGTAALAFSLASAEPTVGPPVQAYGGQGGGGTRQLSDLELTEITRTEESYLAQVNALAKAEDELSQMSYRLPVDRAAIAAQVETIAQAQLALSLSRADAFARLRKEMNATSPQKLQMLAQSISGDTSVGGRAGRGGGPTFPQLFGTAPAGRGN